MPVTGGTTAASGRGLAIIGAAFRDPRRALLVTVVALSAIPTLDVLGDPDLWWHIRAGRWILDNRAIPRTEMFTYTAAGNPWTAHEWGSEVLFALLSSAGGALLLALVMAAVTWSGLWALALRARDRGAGLGVGAAAMLLGARAMQPVAGTRPQMITFALCCWSLLIAERHLARGGRGVWLLPPMAAVWANLHAGFLFGIGLVAAVAAVEGMSIVLRRPGSAPRRRVVELGAVAAASLAASCLNPSGPALIGYALRLTHEVSALPIVEWMRPDLLSWGLAAGDVLALSLVVLVVRLRGAGLPLRDLVLPAAAGVAALLAVRNLAVLVAVATPAWAAAVERAMEAVRARQSPRTRRGSPAAPDHRPAPAVALAVLAAGALALAATGLRAAQAASPAGVAAAEPVCAATVLARSPHSLRVFAPYATSGWLVGRLWPQVRVYDYGELLAPGPQVLADDIRIASGDVTALDLLDRSATDAAVVPDGALTTRLDGAPGTWHRVLTDPAGFALYTRGAPAWATSGC